MNAKSLAAIAALSVLLTGSTGLLSRQWTNLRAIIYQAGDEFEKNMTPEQLAARAHLLLADRKTQLTKCAEQISMSEQKIKLREKNLKTRQAKIVTMKQELELAQRKLLLNNDREELEVSGRTYSRDAVEEDARRRLQELQREVAAVESEEKRLEEMHRDVDSARSRLIDAKAEIEARELDVEEAVVKYRDSEAQRQLKLLLPELNNQHSELNETLALLFAKLTPESDSAAGTADDKRPDYNREIKSLTNIEDDISGFLANLEQTTTGGK